MWQPNATQWKIIWIVAVLLVVCWPPSQGRSLAAKAVNFLADPLHHLAEMPPPLPIGLEDDGDAVTEHDAQQTEYYRQYAASGLTRFRMRLKAAGDPLDTSTERQLLVAIAVASTLVVWRLNEKK
jgi:hypothetical protein